MSSQPGIPELLHTLLPTTAHTVARASRLLCEGSATLKTGACGWYHGTWQYLRQLDLVSSPTWHDEFYMDNLVSAFARAEQALVSGTADYSMLAYMLHARARARAATRILVVDVCRTPLYACRLLTRQQGEANVQICQSDVLKLPGVLRSTFDLIATDAFLTRFSRTEVPRVLHALAQVSRPQATLITSVRVGSAPADPSELAWRVEEFVSRAVAGAAELGLAPEAIAMLAKDYAVRMVSNPVGDANGIASVFLDAGWEIERVQETEVKGELIPTTYARFVVRRV